LGPAEVAAWALLGYIWSLNKYFTAGVADAAEVRCAHHLGMNDPEMARLTAYKSIYLGLVSALFSTSALFLVGENLVRVITPDPTLQRLALELLPLIGVGQIVMSVGTMSWTLLGAQGRRRLATTVQLVGSWGVTIPLGLLFTYGVNINLQGLTTSVILGLSVAGAGNTYILLRSQWDLLAKLFSDGNALDDDTASQDMPPQEEMAPMNGGTNSQICGKSLLDQQGLQSIVDDSSSDGSFSVPLKHIRPTTAE
jgi:Na+-driven multidrug efflux pump